MTSSSLSSLNKAPLLKAAKRLEKRIEAQETATRILFIIAATTTSAAFIF
tara:strand:- start:325 stop:474 length:150 start_codon:yes stop_codon:yes gene_type:complete